jgi:pyrimidine deaminase RibD-like protein
MESRAQGRVNPSNTQASTVKARPAGCEAILEVQTRRVAKACEEPSRTVTGTGRELVISS